MRFDREIRDIRRRAGLTEAVLRPPQEILPPNQDHDDEMAEQESDRRLEVEQKIKTYFQSVIDRELDMVVEYVMVDIADDQRSFEISIEVDGQITVGQILQLVQFKMAVPTMTIGGNSSGGTHLRGVFPATHPMIANLLRT